MNNSKVLVWNIEGKKCRDWDCEGGGGRFISPNMLVFLLPPPRTLVFQSNSLIPDKFVILGTNLTLNVLLFYIVGHRLYDILNKIIIMKPTFRLLLGYTIYLLTCSIYVVSFTKNINTLTKSTLNVSFPKGRDSKSFLLK